MRPSNAMQRDPPLADIVIRATAEESAAAEAAAAAGGGPASKTMLLDTDVENQVSGVFL